MQKHHQHQPPLPHQIDVRDDPGGVVGRAVDGQVRHDEGNVQGDQQHGQEAEGKLLDQVAEAQPTDVGLSKCGF